MGFMKDFKQFAMKGNLVDLAVGFVMGAAFTAVTTSFINGIVMPVVSLIAGKDFSAWKLVLRQAKVDAAGVITSPAIVIEYGNFVSAMLYFIIVAFVMFLVVKAIASLKRKEEEKPAAPPAPTKEEILLTEIRDLLKK